MMWFCMLRFGTRDWWEDSVVGCFVGGMDFGGCGGGR